MRCARRMSTMRRERWQAKLLAAELAFISDRRNKLKAWYDELTKADELSRHLCDQIEVFIDQIGKV